MHIRRGDADVYRQLHAHANAGCHLDRVMSNCVPRAGQNTSPHPLQQTTRQNFLEANARARHEARPREDGQDGELIDINAAGSRKEIGIAGIAADTGIIVVRLRIDQKTEIVECLLDPKAPTADLGLRERAPDFKLMRHQVSTEQLANVEVSVKAQVAVDRSVAIGEPFPCDTGLDVTEIRSGLRNDAAELVIALRSCEREIEAGPMMEQ